MCAAATISSHALSADQAHDQPTKLWKLLDGEREEEAHDVIEERGASEDETQGTSHTDCYRCGGPCADGFSDSELRTTGLSMPMPRHEVRRRRLRDTASNDTVADRKTAQMTETRN